MHRMRTGEEYREALCDGRRVWVMGEGWVEDVTTHPATRAMVDEYAIWYDRHLDPEWQDLLLAPPDAKGPPPVAAAGGASRQLGGACQGHPGRSSQVHLRPRAETPRRRRVKAASE